MAQVHRTFDSRDKQGQRPGNPIFLDRLRSDSIPAVQDTSECGMRTRGTEDNMTSLIGLRSAQSLGLFGLLPFFALAMFAWLPSDAVVAGVQAAALAQRALVAYAAIIVSFLGAIHWGFALLTPGLARTALRQSLLWGVVAPLLAWLALLMMLIGIGPWLVLLFLIGDLLLCRLMDGALLRHYPAAPDWYLELRTRLTIGASIALAIAVPASF